MMKMNDFRHQFDMGMEEMMKRKVATIWSQHHFFTSPNPIGVVAVRRGERLICFSFLGKYIYDRSITFPSISYKKKKTEREL